MNYLKFELLYYFKIVELIIRKPSKKSLGDTYLKHERVGLLCAILFPHMRKELKSEKYMNLRINYSDALDFVLVVLHMLNAGPDQKVNDS